jgi:hypothetical protein
VCDAGHDAAAAEEIVMHDPKTVAFKIRRPWPQVKRAPNGKRHYYWPSWFTIWHVDPETDGSDDSCGWFQPPLTDADRKLVTEMVDWEQRWPHYFAHVPSPGNVTALVFSAFQAFAWRLERRSLAPRDLLTVLQLAATEGDNVCSLFRVDADNPLRRQDDMRRCLSLLLRNYRRMRRPWYRHPKWHLRHWEIQWHFGQTLRRYLLTRCARCGKRFRWGYSPVSHQWERPHEPWWCGESGLFHHECSREMYRV